MESMEVSRQIVSLRELTNDLAQGITSLEKFIQGCLDTCPATTTLSTAADSFKVDPEEYREMKPSPRADLGHDCVQKDNDPTPLSLAGNGSQDEPYARFGQTNLENQLPQGQSALSKYVLVGDLENLSEYVLGEMKKLLQRQSACLLEDVDLKLEATPTVPVVASTNEFAVTAEPLYASEPVKLPERHASGFDHTASMLIGSSTQASERHGCDAAGTHDDYFSIYETLQLQEDSSMGGLFGFDTTELHEHAYVVENNYYETGWAQAVARSNRFQNFTAGIVAVNAVYMGLDSDLNRSTNIYNADIFYILMSNFFCIFFLAELIIRFFAFQQKLDCLRDGWFRFDLFLVTTMIVDQWVLEVYLKVEEGSGFRFPVQPLRLLRLLKITRMARLMRAFPELVTMIKGMVRSLRAISSSAVLVGLMAYIWAILLHMLLKDEVDLHAHINQKVLWWGVDFSTIPRCMWILFMHGTLMLDNAAPLMTVLVFSEKPGVRVAGVFFVLYLFLTALLILQMLIGILTDVVNQVSQERKDMQAIGYVKQQLLCALYECDDGDGRITHQELMKVMAHPKSKAVLENLNVNELFLMQLQKLMFPSDNSTVSIKAVLELMIMCRGDSNATVQTMAGGFCFLERQIGVVFHRMTTLLLQIEKGEQSILDENQLARDEEAFRKEQSAKSIRQAAGLP